MKRKVAPGPIGRALVTLAVAVWLLPRTIVAQGLTGELNGTVKDEQGGVLPGTVVRASSPALIPGTVSVTTNNKGQWHFLALPPGIYAIDVQRTGFRRWHEDGIPVGAGTTFELAIVLEVAVGGETVVVEGASPRIDARNPGFGTRFRSEDLSAIPLGRNSMFSAIRAAPGISPTSPSSSTNTTLSAFGSGINENKFLFDGTDMTCPCSGISRAEPGVDFIQEMHVQSVGASAEFGDVQGAVIDVITRSGSARFTTDASYYAEPGALTSQPVVLPLSAPAKGQSGYERVRYRDFSGAGGGPIAPDHVWFFAGYQYLRDYDSQPGADPAFPRTYEQNKLFLKITSRLTPSLQMENILHYEHWVNPQPPTAVTPFEATTRTSADVPAVTFGHVTHTLSQNTVWDVRVGWFTQAQDSVPSTRDLKTSSHFDQITGVTSFAPPTFGGPTISRTTVKATLTYYRPALFRSDHQLKFGGQFEHGGHHLPTVVPGGTSYVDKTGQPYQAITRDPSQEGGASSGIAAFASDAIAIGERLTVSAGVRFDHLRAYDPDLHAIDAEGRQTDDIVRGTGTLYTWNLVSPRLGATVKLTADGRTILRSSYGRFYQGVLTAEIGPFHPAVTPRVTRTFDQATGQYANPITVDPRVNLLLDPGMKAPHSDEYSVGVDREFGRQFSGALAYVHKNGADYIAWTDVGGTYELRDWPLPDGRFVPAYVLTNNTADRRFLQTNPPGYSLRYDGLVLVGERRRANGWQAFASYTRSKSRGLLPSSGTSPAGPQSSTIAPPTSGSFGQDPNDLINAIGLLPNDRPNIFRIMGSVDVPRTGIAVAANYQYFSGKPWAATTLLPLPQGSQRVLLETRGTRRLPSQSLLDLRVSRWFTLGRAERVELLLDVYNVFNETAAESLATDNLFNLNFQKPTVFVDPRRVMLGAKLVLGR
ncbi:MAG TPA: TonB-dependent receptor [Vicinamibacterales bacterium]|nr:TonB-dependent receptor [Vicinamibacterales bacterium]